MKTLHYLLGARWVSLGWTLMIAVLLCLPGSVLPKEQGFYIPQFDKIVHITLFGGFVFLWTYYFSTRGLGGRRLVKIFFYIFLLACAYGTGLEFVQKYFIPQRYYDEADIIADMVGAGIFYGLANIRLLKFS